MSNLIELFLISIMLKFSHNTFNCRNVTLKSSRGYIVSPNYTLTNRNEVTCTWTIYSSRSVPLHLKINYLDIASCNQCCDSNYLKISNERQELARYCNNKEAQDIVLRENRIILDFRAKHYTVRNKGIKLEFYAETKTCADNQFRCFDGGKCIDLDKLCNSVFDCQDHSDEVNCTYCPMGQTACDYNTKFCFYPAWQRCDGIIDCPGGEDELNCTRACPGKIQCGDFAKCFEKYEYCDKQINCLNGYDERNCSYLACGSPFNISMHFICRNGKCIDRSYVNDGIDDCGDSSDELVRKTSNYLVLAVFLGVFMSTVFVFLICRWLLTRRNINYLMANPPEFPRRQMVCNDYQEGDFRRGGILFEAYLESRRQREGHRTRRSADTSLKENNICAPCNCPSTIPPSKQLATDADVQQAIERYDLERLIFGDVARQKDLSNKSDTSTNSDDDLSLGGDFSFNLLMQEHEEKCLICRSQNTSNNNLSSKNLGDSKSNSCLVNTASKHKNILNRCKSDSNVGSVIVSDFNGFDKGETTLNNKNN